MGLLDNLSRISRPRPAKHVGTGLPVFSNKIVTQLVFAQDDIPEQSRISHDYVHVSSLLDFCARRQILALRDEINLIKQPKGQDRVMWAMGKAAEHHVRSQVMRALNYQGVIGVWTCLCAKTTYPGYFDHNRKCPRCGQLAYTYGEFPTTDEEYKIIGHPDFLFTYDGKLLVLETKSMNKTDFEKLTEPLPDHVFQASAYHRMWLGRGTVPVRDEVAIVYVMKDYRFKSSPYLEFHVNPYEPKWQAVLDVAWNNANIVRASLEAGTIPPRILACPNVTTTTARNCPCATGCFSRS